MVMVPVDKLKEIEEALKSALFPPVRIQADHSEVMRSAIDGCISQVEFAKDAIRELLSEVHQ